MRFRILNTDVTLSFWFFAVITLFIVSSTNELALCFALPVILHELGHIIAIIAFNIKIKAIRFTAFGIEIEKEKNAKGGVVREVVVGLAGIAANLIVAAALYFFAYKSMLTMLMISANLAVAMFNLLPIGNLDGGEIAKNLSEYFFKPRLAYLLSRIFSFLALVPLFAASIFLLLLPGRNFTLLLLCVYLLIDVISKG